MTTNSSIYVNESSSAGHFDGLKYITILEYYGKYPDHVVDTEVVGIQFVMMRMSTGLCYCTLGFDEKVERLFCLILLTFTSVSYPQY